MKALLRKEFTLSLFPLPYCFWLLTGLLLIPNYPYFVTFFYAALGVMFLFQYNRENRDLNYMMTLPITKGQMVKARVVQTAAIELGMLVACLPFMAVRGLFNLIFLPGFYRDGRSIGLPFLFGSLAQAVYMLAMEILLRIVPYFARWCDRMDLAAQLHQLPVLAVGLAVYALLTLGALRISIRRFARIDL